MAGLVETYLRIPEIQRHVVQVLEHLIRRSGTDGALIAAPESDTGKYRLWPLIPGDLPFAQGSIPVGGNPAWTEVLGTGRVVGISDMARLPPEAACGFMIAEEFSSFLGAPLIIAGHREPSAIVAVVGHDPRAWSEADRNLITLAATALSDMMSGNRADVVRH